MSDRTRHEFRDGRGLVVLTTTVHRSGRCEVYTFAAWDTTEPADKERAAAWLRQWFPQHTHDQTYAMLTIGRPEAHP